MGVANGGHRDDLPVDELGALFGPQDSDLAQAVVVRHGDPPASAKGRGQRRMGGDALLGRRRAWLHMGASARCFQGSNREPSKAF